MDALALGSAYALLGSAVSVVAIATRTLHLAIGQVVVAGAMGTLILGSGAIGWPLPVALVVGMALGAGVSALLGPVVLERLGPGLPGLIGLVVAAGTLDAVLLRTLGTVTLRPALPGAAAGGVDGGVTGGVTGVLVVGLAAVGALAGLLAATRTGRRLRLVGGSDAAAERAGVDPARTRTLALAIAGAAAVLAGLLAAPVAFLGAGQAAALTVRGVAAAVVVGRGGPRWALVGGMALGAAEAAGAGLWPAAGGELGVALLVVVVLAVRGAEHHRTWGRAW